MGKWFESGWLDTSKWKQNKTVFTLKVRLCTEHMPASPDVNSHTLWCTGWPIIRDMTTESTWNSKQSASSLSPFSYHLFPLPLCSMTPNHFPSTTRSLWCNSRNHREAILLVQNIHLAAIFKSGKYWKLKQFWKQQADVSEQHLNE